MRLALIPVILLGIVGIVAAGYAFFADDTGVTGSFGALLALIGAVAVSVGGLIASSGGVRGGLFGTLAFLIGLAAALTAIAGYFLMQYVLAGVMALALLALLFAAIIPDRQRRLV